MTLSLSGLEIASLQGDGKYTTSSFLRYTSPLKFGVNGTNDFTFCTHPTEYSLDILNNAQKNLVIESIKDVSGLEPVVSHIESCDYNSKLVQKFWEATEFTKNYRKLDLEEYLPELHTLIK